MRKYQTRTYRERSPAAHSPKSRAERPGRPSASGEAIGTIGGCTATLITEYAALTAAHCVTNGQRRTFILPNGRGSIDGTAIQHPLFGQLHWFSYDYAIVQFDASIYETGTVNASGLTPMPVSAKTLRAGDGAFMYGYGGFGGDCSEPSDGQARYRWIAISDVSEDWHYAYRNSEAGICPGDSGGPLVVDDNGWKVAGVNSWTGGDASHFKSSYMAFDWIREHASGPDLPGDTWGNCVLYTNWTDGAYLSIRGNLPSFDSYPAYDNATSTVWVRKGFKATLYDGAGYSGDRLYAADGFVGSRCNEFGCVYELEGTAADDSASSLTCESVLPQDTWGHCVYYNRFGDGGYYSTQGNASSFSGEFAYWNNRASQIWVKKGHTAEVFPDPSYGGTNYWRSVIFNGERGNWCNASGCLHDLVGTVAEKTASSITCQ
ncbi:MAG: trypsin-like serine protease [Vicinamibacteraceae bacterium]